MAIGIGIGLSPAFGGGGGGGPVPIPAPFASVNGPTSDPFGGSKFEGWSANYSAQPTISSPVAFTVSRQGYTATDSTTTNSVSTTSSILDTYYVTKAVRQSWPNNANQSALSAAISDYIYSTDTPSGSVTNNSTLVSPKPVARWALPGRRTVGNSVRLEVVAFHRDARDGKQVAAVVFTATDGTNTVTRTVATPTVLGYTNDRFAVIGYGCDLDITSLNNNDDFTVDAVVYPWIGASTASQRRSVDGTASNYYEFATQTYYKSTSRASSPPLVYVTATGVDAVVDVNGQAAGITKVSTNAATAKTNAFATWVSAVQALKAATNVTGGFTDGCELRVSNTTMSIAAGVAAGTYQSVSEFVVTRDPLETKASCIITIGAAAANTRHSWLKFRDVTFNRAGGTSTLTVLAGQTVVENVDFDNSSWASQIIGSATHTTCWIGTAITNGSVQLLGAGTTPTGLVRGCTGSGLTIEVGCVVGNSITAATTAFSATASRSDNSVFCFNLAGSLTTFLVSTQNVSVSGLAVCQNVMEFISGTSNPNYRPSADGATGNLTHVVTHNNTFTGAGNAGRLNAFYDETDNVRRVHTLVSFKGNLLAANLNTKGDIFHGDNDGNPEGYNAGNPSQAIGQWPFYYGVGCAWNFVNYATANDASEAQEYAGRGSLVGTSNTAPLVTNADLFTANQSTTYNGLGISTPANYTAGAGGGTYTLANNVNNTAKGIVEDALFIVTLDNVARSLTGDNPGAMSAAA